MEAEEKISQILVVQKEKTAVSAAFYEREKSRGFEQVFAVLAHIGKNGFGKEREGDGKTPTGLFEFGQAFGILENPGTEIPYTKIDDSHYWVSDPKSVYYNSLVSTRRTPGGFSREQAEHLITYRELYRYGLEIRYNPGCESGKGSAIFLHCSKGKDTQGCVAIPETYMAILLKHLRVGARILIRG